MFEAVQLLAPRMVEAGLTKYSNPTSILRALQMLLSHIGYLKESKRLEKALDLCCLLESEIKVTGLEGGATTKEFTEYLLKQLAV